jgi:hypothetical protein
MGTNNCNCDKNCICTDLDELQVITGTITKSVKTIDGSISIKSNSLSGNISNRGIVGGTKDYEELINKPSIETVILIGDKTFEDLGLSPMNADDLLEILT